jgi:hypothetical protein
MEEHAMKTIFYATIACLFVLFLGSTISGQALRAFALEGSSMNSDVPKQSAKELKDDMPSEALSDDDAKNPCPPSYIKLVSPRAAAVGATVSLQGWRFGKDAGQVIFPNGVSAKIIFWRYQNIDVEVPDGAVSGNIAVISACGSENKKGAGSYFKVMEKPKGQ